MSKYVRKFMVEVGPMIIGLATFTYILTIAAAIFPDIVESQDTFTEIAFIAVSLIVALSQLFFWWSKIPPQETKETEV